MIERTREAALAKLRWQNYRAARIAHLERVPNDTSCVTRKLFARETSDTESAGLAAIKTNREHKE